MIDFIILERVIVGVNMRTIKDKDQQGTTLVELAAILSLLFLLTFGMIDFGRYLYTASTVQAAAQAGARAGLGHNGVGNLAAAVSSAQNSLITLKSEDATITAKQPTPEIIEVTVTYRFKFITPFLAPLYSTNTLQIQSGATMVIY